MTLVRLLGRIIAIVLVGLIILTTAIAFWAYNADRVLLDPNTYKSGLHNSAAYTDLLTALIGGAATANNTPRNADVLLKNLPPLAWDQIQAQVFPDNSAAQAIDNVIDNLRNWIDGKISIPNPMIDLQPIKANLSGVQAQQAIQAIWSLPDRQTCIPVQVKALTDFTDKDSFDKLPICAPVNNPDLLTKLNGQLAEGLAILGQKLPTQWSLAEELHTQQDNQPLVQPGRMTEAGLQQARASIWLSTRLLVILFLIPIALICLVVIVTVRTGKGFFRWLGWALILSGFFSLLPVLGFSNYSPDKMNVALFSGANLSAGELAFDTFAHGAVGVIVSALTVSVLVQVAILIVFGLIAVFLSVLIPPPPPELTEAELQMLLAQGGATPAPIPVAKETGR